MSKHTTSGFKSALLSSWALLFGFGILMIGDGLQGTLLAVRADLEGFSTTTTGIIMSSFYLGFLIGSIITTKIVISVGHIRVFAALAALASAAILVHALFISTAIWIGLRLVSGFCLAGLYVVAESWLNDKATNETRGQILSLYMIVTYVGVAIGQLLLNYADPSGFPLFILISILISVAVIPLLLSASPTPSFEESENLKLTELIRISPVGSMGMFVIGFVSAAFFSVGPVYAKRIGLELEFISYFMAISVLGTILLQWPIGYLSDKFDRRRVIVIISLLAAISAVTCSMVAASSMTLLLICVGVFGGLSLPLYSLCVAYTNDRLDPSQMVAASGSLVLMSGIGAVLGPFLVSALMEHFGTRYFFLALALTFAFMTLLTLFRIQVRKPGKKSSPITMIPSAYHYTSTAVENTQQYVKDELDEDD